MKTDQERHIIESRYSKSNSHRVLATGHQRQLQTLTDLADLPTRWNLTIEYRNSMKTGQERHIIESRYWKNKNHRVWATRHQRQGRWRTCILCGPLATRPIIVWSLTPIGQVVAELEQFIENCKCDVQLSQSVPRSSILYVNQRPSRRCPSLKFGADRRCCCRLTAVLTMQSIWLWNSLTTPILAHSWKYPPNDAR